MAGRSSGMLCWSWTEVSVLGSQVFGQALMESCDKYIKVLMPTKSVELKKWDLGSSYLGFRYIKQYRKESEA